MAHRRRLAALLRAKAAAARRHLNQLASVRVLRNPRTLIDDLIYRIDELDGLAGRAIRRRIAALREKLGAIAFRADALSPLAVLGRGYSVTSDAESGRVLTSAGETAVAKQIRTRLSVGSFVSRVESIETDTEGRHS
jgi:exodeoxyribonuclease VII large subunit